MDRERAQEVAEQIKALRKIQHLVLIRDEAVQIGATAKQDELGANLATLEMTLNEEALALYKRLSVKSRIFLSPLSKGNCSACGMKVPTSVMQHVIGGDRLVMCSNCGRLIYLPDVKSTGVSASQPDPKYMLSRFSSVRLVTPDLKAETKEEAIAELCGLLAKENVIVDLAAVRQAALEREAIMTTAVGGGMAFPHMRGVEEGVLTFAAGVSRKGIDWGGEHVNFVVFTTLPIVASPFYLKLLAAFVKSFSDGEKLPFVLAAEDAKTLWKELNKAMRTNIKNIMN